MLRCGHSLLTRAFGFLSQEKCASEVRGASGFWVEGGEIAFPVNELTIAGSLPDFLKSLTPANDADLSKSLVCPSLLVEGLTVASG